MSSFLSGLLNPSALSVAVALSIVLAATASYVFLVDVALVADRGDVLLAKHPTDYDSYSTIRALQLQRSSRQHTKLVVVGGSTVRASLLEEDLRASLDAHGFPEVEIYKLCTGRQSLWDSLVLVEHIPSNARGVLIVGVGPSLFTMGREDLEELNGHPRLGLRSMTVDEALRDAGLPVRDQTGNYAVDNAAFLLARYDVWLKTLLRGHPAGYVDSRHLDAPRLVEKDWQERAQRVNKRLDFLEANWDSNAAVLQRIVDDVRRRTSMEVILVETPTNPEFLEEFGRHAVFDGHRARMREFADRNDLPYVVLDEDARLARDDFSDWAHLSNRSAVERSAEATMPYVIRSLASIRKGTGPREN